MSDKTVPAKGDEAVPVVTRDGRVGYLPAALANDPTATEGLRHATDDQLRGAQVQTNKSATKAALDAEFSGSLGAEAEGAVAPALAGAARGLTLGASDVALAGIGGDRVRRRLLDYQEYAPISSAAGEVGAIAGTALLGDEAGLGRLPGLVSKFGAGVESGLARGLGEGLLARGVGMAARGGAEGAIYNTGKAFSDAALHDDEMTAEKVVAAGVHGLETGAAVGAGLGVLGAGASRLTSGIRRAAKDEAAAVSSLGSPRKPTSIGDALQEGADVKTFKALGGSAGDLRALEANVPGGFRKVAQDVRGDIEATTGKSIGYHNRESIHDYASARVEELGNQLGGMLKKLDESGGQAPSAENFVKQAREDVLSKFLVQTPAGPVVAPGAGKVVKAVDGYLAQIEKATEGRAPSFTEWQGWRKNLDKSIYEGVTKSSPSVDALRQVRALMEKELETSGEAAASTMGASFLDQYQATKSLYQSVKKAEELSARGVAAELGRNSVGLGATIGAATGLATGGPLAGIAMGAIGKVVKDRGDMLAADLLGRAANVIGVTKLVARSNAKLSQGVASLVGGKAAEAGASATSKASGGFISSLLKGAGDAVERTTVAGASTQRAEFARRAAAISALTTNPAMLSSRVGDMLGPVADASPKVAAATTAKVLGDLQFLASKMPPSHQDPYSLQPQFQPQTRASDSEIAKHARYVEALDHPTMILDLARKGGLTPDHVEAVKERYPKMYEEMRGEIFRGLIESKTEVPYGRRIQLGILLDLPTDKTLAPDFVRAIQATYSASEKAGQEPPPPQLTQLDVADSLMTGTQSAMSEGQDR